MAQISVKSNKDDVEKQHAAQVRLYKIQASAALSQYNAALADLTDNWGTLTAAQKQETMRTMLVILARSVRFLMLKFIRL
ncbi:MAG: hypothetical protein K8I82_23085 [Anaerolineae bacterium]|nr:hypothetical protein [Anaerolineae bacterium]